MRRARNQSQDVVGRRMTEGVVDRFEAVDVQEQHGKWLAATLGQCDRRGESVVQRQAVWQAGQRVVLGEMRHLPRRLEGDADIAKHDDGASHAPILVIDGCG